MKKNIITIITTNSTLTDTMIIDCGKYSVIVKDVHGDIVVTKHPNRAARRGFKFTGTCQANRFGVMVHWGKDIVAEGFLNEDSTGYSFPDIYSRLWNERKHRKNWGHPIPVKR